MVDALGLEAFHDGVDGSHDGAGPFGVEDDWPGSQKERSV
jgi:hypothetical protein